MDTQDKNIKQLKNLAYRLRKTVTCIEKKRSLHLVLSYPLKSIVIHPSWAEVLKRLSTGIFIPFDEILSQIVPSDPNKVEFFLNDLVRRGCLDQKGISPLSKYPSISIIIPVRNRPHDLKACIESVVQLNYPQDKLEIIVVDDASTDNTLEIAAKFPVRLIALKQNKKAPYCRNLAARQAHGDILAFIDSDCLADRSWLMELVPAFKDPVIAAVGGMVESYYNSKALDRYEQVRSSLNLGGWPRRSTKNDRFFYVPSCNLLVIRSFFLYLEGFKEELVVGEDVDLCWRIQDHGYHIEYRPVGKIYHKHRNRLNSFCARRFDYGTSEPLLQRLHAERRKQMVFTTGASVFWSIAIFAILFKSALLLALCGITVFGDATYKLTGVKHRCIPIKFKSLFIPVLRSYFAFFYNCCAFFSRYYLIGSIVIFPLFPLAAKIIVGMHLLTGFMEFFIKKPRLTIVLFLFYFTLEQLSYQSGVWWECLRKFSFNAVNPRITL